MIEVSEVVRHLWPVSRQVFPEGGLVGTRRRMRFMLHGLRHLQRVKAWFECQDNPRLAAEIKRWPGVSRAVYMPYLNIQWCIQRRLAAIAQHYQQLDGHAAVLDMPAGEQRELCSGGAEQLNVRLVLERPQWLRSEGEVALSLFSGAERVYSMAFTLGRDDKALVAYVGAIQGAGRDDAQALYKDLTHALHGMRPRDFLVSGFQLLCAHMGVDVIRAVRDDSHLHRHRFFRDKPAKRAEFDVIWTELGGTPSAEPGFYDLPARFTPRDDADVPARKRAMYRRRYAFLAQLDTAMGSTCSRAARAPAAAAHLAAASGQRAAVLAATLGFWLSDFAELPLAMMGLA